MAGQRTSVLPPDAGFGTIWSVQSITWIHRPDASPPTQLATHPGLISSLLEESGPPYSRSTSFHDLVTPSFPPTIFVKALADTRVYPVQTSDAYKKLNELGVETKLIEAEGMLHGDAEGENDILDHPPRRMCFGKRCTRLRWTGVLSGRWVEWKQTWR